MARKIGTELRYRKSIQNFGTKLRTESVRLSVPHFLYRLSVPPFCTAFLAEAREQQRTDL